MSIANLLKPCLACVRSARNGIIWANTRRQNTLSWLHADPRNRIFAIMSLFVLLEFLAIFYVIGYENNMYHPGGILLMCLVGIVTISLIYIIVIHLRSPQRIRSFILNQEGDQGVTAEQKQKIKRVVTLDEENVKSFEFSEEDLCSVCLCEMAVGNSVAILPCSHGYHDSCLEEWIKQHHTCPLCNLNLNSYRADEDCLSCLDSDVAPMSNNPQLSSEANIIPVQPTNLDV
mmetsp:Transcript_27641/g.36265  ORF Transcript_27641/g.36265 Transcript_27641/m.36265 type:complete len:231 (+) Transcript_27641:212-904(+)